MFVCYGASEECFDCWIVLDGCGGVGDGLWIVEEVEMSGGTIGIECSEECGECSVISSVGYGGGSDGCGGFG